jgi:hypothetical protein
MPITRTLARGIGNYDDDRSLGSNLRRQRLAPLLGMIDTVHEARGAVSIIDVGGTENYWNIVPRSYLEQRDVGITIVNLPGKRKPDDHGRFRFVEGDGCDLGEYASRSFDIAHSNSVLEHVGDYARMARFAEEVGRVADGYFIQTPNFWFPIEPHSMTPFFHWLPRSARIALVSRFQLGYWSKAKSSEHAERIVDSARLVNRRKMHELFADADIVTERLLGLPKSFIAVRRPSLDRGRAPAEPRRAERTAAGG